jgi:ABC-type sugar transport system substrate-binding protein
MDQLQRASTRGRRVVVGILACVGLSSIAPMAAAAPADKVTICHATGSESNPYVQITVAAAAADAHLRHQHGEDVIGSDDGSCSGEVGPPEA